MTEESVRNTMTTEAAALERGLLPVAPLAMPPQRLEAQTHWLRDALAAPLRGLLQRSREV